MPIYEYRCRSCGHTTEHLRTVEQADEPVSCVCDGEDTVRLPSLVARSRHATSGAALPMAGDAPGPTAGGCCGGGCCG